MNILEIYPRELSEIRSSRAAIKENSYYDPQAKIDKPIKPMVKCVINLQGRGDDRF